jgi:phosphoserine aminotransferase
MSLYDRVYNFSAGPGTLPVAVLERVRDELLNHGESGMSVLEMSHRGGPYDAIHAQAQADLRALMEIPENYKVLFLQGGASLQFTMVAQSFGNGDYVVTGAWGEKAVEAARIEGRGNLAWDGKEDGYVCVPEPDEISLHADADYVHITSNETIGGVQWKKDPRFDLPLVCDMSSDVLSRPVDVARYGLIYAGAQKNMGPAGATLVVIREDLLERVPKGLAPMLDYRVQAANDSRYNTPPTFSIYVCGLVYKHLLEIGGLEAVAERNARKASAIYGAIDAGFYQGHADSGARSSMNVVFTLPSEELTKAFLKEAEAQGFSGLKGHRSVGGVRASIYNAFPLEGCEALATFMRDFAQRNG